MDRILFSPPASFIPGIRERYEAVAPTLFHEIWHRDDLPAADELATITAWVCQPGQSFVVDDAVLDAFPRLSVLVTASTGNNHVDLDAVARRGIPFFSLLDDRPQLEAISASAEMTFLLLLGTLRRIHVCVDELRSGRWREREADMRGHELQGRRVGLVGLGRIGRRMRRYCEAFEARVSYYDPYVDVSDLERHASIEALFDGCDDVVICCSLTPETRGMVGAELLARLRPGATFVNSARGEIVDEQALADLIDARPDVRVGLDVISGEVTGTQYDSPVLSAGAEAQRLVVPHIAGATIESQARAAFLCADLVARHLARARG